MDDDGLRDYQKQKIIESLAREIAEKKTDEPESPETCLAENHLSERIENAEVDVRSKRLQGPQRETSKGMFLEKEFRVFLSECFTEDNLVELQRLMGLQPGKRRESIDRVVEIVRKWLPIEYWYPYLLTDLSTLVNERSLFDYCSDNGISTRGETEEVIKRVLSKLQASDVQVPISLRDILPYYKIDHLKRILKHMGYTPKLSTRTAVRKDELIDLIMIGFEKTAHRDRLDDFKVLLRQKLSVTDLEDICVKANISSEGVKRDLFDRIFEKAIIRVLAAEGRSGADGRSELHTEGEEADLTVPGEGVGLTDRDLGRRRTRRVQPRVVRTLAFLDQTVPFKLSKEIPIIVARTLIQSGKLDKTKLPVACGYSRYLISEIPKHKDGKDFYAPVQLENGWWVETHRSESRQLKLARMLLVRCGEENPTVQILLT